MSPYIGASLEAAVAALEPVTERAARAIVDETGDFMLRRVRELTPVETSHLRESWEKKKLEQLVSALTHRIYRTGVETDVEYAPYVEYPTGLWGPKGAKYLIVPRTPGGVLHFFAKSGDEVFAAFVWHPGSPGRFMVAKTVADTEATLHELTRPTLILWAREGERAMEIAGRLRRA